MTDSSAQQKTENTEENIAKPAIAHRFSCSPGHVLLTLVGATFIIFEILFIDLYSDNFWFSFNIEWLGLPMLMVAALLAALLLTLMETRVACKAFSVLRKGAPPMVFRKWLITDESGITFGLRHVKWSAIDDLRVTWLGNLQIRSRILCGDVPKDPDVILTAPFGMASPQDQKRLIAIAQQANPNIKIDGKLMKRISSPILAGQNMVQFIGAGMMTIVLVDVGLSSFHWLEMLKHYHLANKAAIAAEGRDFSKAADELKLADKLRDNQIPFSYAATQFLNKGVSAAGVLQARAEALMAMNRPPEAIADIKSAIAITPENFRLYLKLARYYQDTHQTAEAKSQIQKAIEKHKNSLLPRLYLISILNESQPDSAKATYKETQEHLLSQIFDTEPIWPPGGNRFVTDVFYQPDIHFVFDRLLNVADTRKDAVPLTNPVPHTNPATRKSAPEATSR